MGATLPFFFFQAEDGIRVADVTGVQTCALPITTRAIGARRTGSVRLAAGAAVAVAVAYGLLGALVAGLITTPGLGVSSLRAGLTLGVFGLVGALGGSLTESGAYARLVAASPAMLRDAVRTGLVGALLVLGAGAAT